MANAMLNTNVIFYLMIAIGVIGALAKVVTQVTLRRLVRASADMQKSTHKLIKLVRSKYEHACLAYDTVDNTGAFVEKFIHEYRSLGLRLHTWQQIQRQSVWFAAILAALGMAVHYNAYGLCEMMYRYAMSGTAEVVLLLTLFRMSDDGYKINVIRVYMVDYLENVYSHRYQKMKQYGKDRLNVISPEMFSHEDKTTAGDPLAINIEGEPKRFKREEGTGKRSVSGLSGTGETARQAVREMAKDAVKGSGGMKVVDQNEDIPARDAEDTGEETEFREDAIRHILEEFLA